VVSKMSAEQFLNENEDILIYAKNLLGQTLSSEDRHSIVALVSRVHKWSDKDRELGEKDLKAFVHYLHILKSHGVQSLDIRENLGKEIFIFFNAIKEWAKTIDSVKAEEVVGSLQRKIERLQPFLKKYGDLKVVDHTPSHRPENTTVLQTKKDNNDGSGSGNTNDLINSPALQTKKDNNDGSGGNTNDLINSPALQTKKR